MNLRKLIENSEAFLNSDERKRKQKRKFLKQVIKKLKQHEKSLQKKLRAESDSSHKKKLEQEIALAHAQRKKGLKQLKKLEKRAKS